MTAKLKVWEARLDVAYEGTMRSGLFENEDDAIARAFEWMLDEDRESNWEILSKHLYSCEDSTIFIHERWVF